MKYLLASTLLVVAASARHHDDMNDWRSMGQLPGKDWQPVDGMGNATFKQLIDHSKPELGTFEQFYYYDTTYWKGPGSPVVLFTPGEVNATGYTSYLTTNRTTGVIAEKIGAATIVLEHRYWGTSTPFTDLTTENLKYLTLDNSIKDITNFARNAHLPFAKHTHSNARDVPWVFSGGSYSGALSAWVEAVDPGTIWAYHSSSAPVEAISDYWGYFLPVQQGMPKNCSADVSLVIDHMDEVLTSGSEDEILALKTKFGLQDVKHNDDFMATLENGPWLWQGNQFYRNTGFFDWCDYIENVHVSQVGNGTNSTLTPYANTTVPGVEGVGLEKALEGYAAWVKEDFLPGYCESFGYFEGENNTDCLDSYNPNNPMFTDTSLSNTLDRQWVWMTCNEPFGYWQTGAPRDRPTIVSRLVTADYYIRQCGLYFPPAPDGTEYGIAEGRKEEDVNGYTDGWQNVNTQRLIYVNGDFDPWREASVSSDLRPNGPLQSTKDVPVKIVPGGFHTSDLVTQNGEVNAAVQQVIDEVVEQIAEWVDEFPKHKHWRA